MYINNVIINMQWYYTFGVYISKISIDIYTLGKRGIEIFNVR